MTIPRRATAPAQRLRSRPAARAAIRSGAIQPSRVTAPTTERQGAPRVDYQISRPSATLASNDTSVWPLLARRDSKAGRLSKTPRVETFGWYECAEKLDRLLSERTLLASGSGNHFVSADQFDGRPAVEFFVPGCFPLTSQTQIPEDYLNELSDELGDHLLLLIQAGAAALGWWSDEEVIYQKVLKTYVVRGRGRAQTTYAKTKGKSRYGSRLRLQNAQQHLVDISERIHDWWDELGPPDRIFFSCPQRSWPELFAARPSPPFDQRDERLSRIPMHVHVPNAEELQRVRRKLLRGRIVYSDDLS